MFSEYRANLANLETIASPFLDFDKYGGYKATVRGVANMTLDIESRADFAQAAISEQYVLTSSMYELTLPTPQRYVRAVVTNATGSPVNSSLEVRGAPDVTAKEINGQLDVVISTDAVLDVSVQGTVPISSASPLDVNVQGTVPISSASALDVNVQGTVPISSASALDVNVQGTVPISSSSPLDVSVQGTVPISSASALDVSVQSAPPAQGTVGLGTGLTGDQNLRLSTEGALINAPRCLSQALADGLNNTQELPRSCAGAFIATPVFPVVYNGTTWDRFRGDTNGAYVQVQNTVDVSVQNTPTVLQPRGQISVGILKNSSVTNTGANMRNTALYIHGWQVISTAGSKGIIGLYNTSGVPSNVDTDFVIYVRAGDTVTEMLPPGREVYFVNGLGVRAQTDNGALALTNNNAVSANSICLKVWFST